MKKIKEVFRLFLIFLKLGCFTFGGGWSIVAQMQRIFVEERKSITDEELMDLTSVARSLPGTMVCNVALLFGYRCCGAAGGFACVFGMVLPPFIVVSVITSFYAVFRDNGWITAAMRGIRAAVVPIILSAAVKMVKGAFKFPPCVPVMVVCLILYLVFDMNCVYLVLIGAVCGIAISEYYERRSGGKTA